MTLLKKTALCLQAIITIMAYGPIQTNAQEGFSTSNERSLYDAQTRAMRQKARSQLETDTQKVRDIAQDNLTLDQISARVEECTELGKVYNGDPTDSGNPDIYCQSIVGSVPTEINFIGLAAWYDMNSSSGVELDENGRVAKLIDKAGGGYHLEQASASQRPSVITTDDYNAKANSGITLGRFDGNDALVSPNNITRNLGISGNYEASIFAVFAYDSTASGNDLSVFRMGSGSATGSRLGFLNNGSTPKYTVHHNNMGYSSNWPTDTERLILMDYHKEKDSTNADLYINGTATTLAITGTPNVQDGPLRVGQWGDTGHHMKGDIAELIIYNRQLSEAQRASVQSYLMNKYGLQPFVNCPSQTVSTGECTAATGTGNHADTRILSCTGTYGDCSNEQICRDGNWQEVSNSCPPPADCTTVSRSILGQCSANSGAVLHNVTANLSCAGTYGTCTAKSTCFNGAMGATFDEACPAPNKCFALAAGYSYNSGQGTYVTQATIPESAIGQTQTVEAMRDGVHLGQLTVRCEATGQFSVTNADVYRCPTTTVNNCDLTGSSTAGYGYHAQTSGTCSTGFSGACNYQCQRGSWSLSNNSCAQGCGDLSINSTIYAASSVYEYINKEAISAQGNGGQVGNVECEFFNDTNNITQYGSCLYECSAGNWEVTDFNAYSPCLSQTSHTAFKIQGDSKTYILIASSLPDTSHQGSATGITYTQSPGTRTQDGITYYYSSGTYITNQTFTCNDGNWIINNKNVNFTPYGSCPAVSASTRIGAEIGTSTGTIIDYDYLSGSLPSRGVGAILNGGSYTGASRVGEIQCDISTKKWKISREWRDDNDDAGEVFMAFNECYRQELDSASDIGLTCPSTSCSAAYHDGSSLVGAPNQETCHLSATSNGGTSGTCFQWGTCSATCNNGAWTNVVYNCDWD